MFKRLACLIVMSSPVVQVAHAAELQPFTANFNVTWHGMSAGHSQLELARLQDGRWSYSSRSSAQGLFRVFLPAELKSRSEFSIKNGQIVPEHFTGDDGTDSKRRDQDLRFDWASGRVTGVAETRPVDLPLQPGLQDGMTIQVALIHALLAGHPPTRFLMVDKTKIKEYEYTGQGEETIPTPHGPRHTVVYRSGRPGSEDGTWFWCDPEQSFLPVKVERRSGKKVEWSMSLESAKVGGT
jgi:hypothetical protein